MGEKGLVGILIMLAVVVGGVILANWVSKKAAV